MIVLSMGHKFGPDLICPCGQSHYKHQARPRKCTYVSGKCKLGHKMTPQNTFVQGGGTGEEECIACMKHKAEIGKSQALRKAEKEAGQTV